MFVGERKVEVTQGGNWRLLPDFVPGPGQVFIYIYFFFYCGVHYCFFFVCIWERERESEWVSVCVCVHVCERERERVCVCVCMCVCAAKHEELIHIRIYVIMHTCLYAQTNYVRVYVITHTYLYTYTRVHTRIYIQIRTIARTYLYAYALPQAILNILLARQCPDSCWFAGGCVCSMSCVPHSPGWQAVNRTEWKLGASYSRRKRHNTQMHT